MISGWQLDDVWWLGQVVSWLRIFQPIQLQEAPENPVALSRHGMFDFDALESVDPSEQHSTSQHLPVSSIVSM